MRSKDSTIVWGYEDDFNKKVQLIPEGNTNENNLTEVSHLTDQTDTWKQCVTRLEAIVKELGIDNNDLHIEIWAPKDDRITLQLKRLGSIGQDIKTPETGAFVGYLKGLNDSSKACSTGESVSISASEFGYADIGCSATFNSLEHLVKTLNSGIRNQENKITMGGGISATNTL